MINAKRIFIIVFTCLLSLSINNVYAQNHGSLNDSLSLFRCTQPYF